MVHQLRIPLSALALLLGLPFPLSAQTLDPAFHIPEVCGEEIFVDAAHMPNGQHMVAGSFTRANDQASKSLARFYVTATEDQIFRQNLSCATMTIKELVPMANG